MKRKLGIGLILIGVLLIAAAVGLLMYNRVEEERAGEAVREVIPQVVEVIQERQQERQEEIQATEVTLSVVVEEPDPSREMETDVIDGNAYIGFLSIPSVQLELPVMADWSDEKLQIAPCRYAGTTYADNLVIMAHNYSYYFGRLSEVRNGDLIVFTDMEGVQVTYEAVAMDILEPTAIEEMTAGDYDLTLFTCTYGGKSRVTLRCMRLED